MTGALTGANAARGVFWMRDPRYLLLSTVVALCGNQPVPGALWRAVKYLDQASRRWREARRDSAHEGAVNFDFHTGGDRYLARPLLVVTRMPSCPRTLLSLHYDRTKSSEKRCACSSPI